MMNTLLNLIFSGVLMSTVTIQNPVAEATLATASSPSHAVTVKIGHPELDPLDPDGKTWRSAWVVEGLPGARVRYAHGVNGIQAIQQAIEAARQELERSSVPVGLTPDSPGEYGIGRIMPWMPPPVRKEVDRFIQEKVNEAAQPPPLGSQRGPRKAPR